MPLTITNTLRLSLILLGVLNIGLSVHAFNLEESKATIEQIRVKHKLPALGAAIVTEEGAIHIITTGTRRRGNKTSVTDEDLWHLGSCGKAITATMIARLVEQEKLRFDQTLGETFPKLSEEMKEPLTRISINNLLSHHSGLPANFSLGRYTNEKSPKKARHKVLQEAMENPLLADPGDKYLYSNWGYTLAGHIAEEATGKSWESLIQREVFRPLGMKTAGFGGVGTKGKVDQPWPHNMLGIPMLSNGKEMDNLPVMGPAGTMHMSLADWGKFVAEHLKGNQGKSKYLTKDSFNTLHTPVGDNYAMGWVVTSRGWAGGKALTHSGDNTMNHAVVWMAPEKGFAVLVVTNQSSAGKATEEAASKMIQAWLAKNETN